MEPSVMDGPSRARIDSLFHSVGGFELRAERAKPLTAEWGDSAESAVGVYMHAFRDTAAMARWLLPGWLLLVAAWVADPVCVDHGAGSLRIISQWDGYGNLDGCILGWLQLGVG